MLKLLPFLTLILLVVIFFGKTATGQEVFVTPDFGLSDILMAEYPAKYFLAESLKHGQLPLWNPLIATGFPHAAITTGTFNPINLIIFGLLPMPQAYNIAFAVIFLTAGIFTFLFCRSIRLSHLSSLFSAIIFMFSGVFVTQIVHFVVIQTLSYFPLELYLVEMYLQKRKSFLLPLLAIAIGFSILAGFFQVVLNSLVVLGIYVTVRLFGSDPQKKTASIKGPIITLALAVVSGFLVAAIQLLPSWEFTKISTREGGVSVEDIKRFPYPPKHLLTYLSPYLLGDPRRGTYAVHSENWGIFWENTGYIGILPLILAGLAIAWYLRYQIVKARGSTPIGVEPLIITFLIILVVSLLLMLGKNSPTFFLFQFPPLSLFRVPARWIMFFTFALCILAGLGFEITKKILDKKIANYYVKLFILPAILIIATLDLFYFSINYNLRGPTEKWFKTPETAKFLKDDKSLYRIDTGGTAVFWNGQFLKRGWVSGEENYLTFLNSLDPNWNVVYGVEHVSTYLVILSARDATVSSIRNQNDRASRNLFDLENVKYIVSPLKIEGRDLEAVFKTETNPAYFVYQNKTVFPRALVVVDWILAKTGQEQSRVLASDTFDGRKTVILEKPIAQKSFRTKVWTTKFIKYTNQEIEVEAESDGGGILVLADSFYPGWKAYVDGGEKEILAANINQRAVILDKGKHIVKFVYEPESFKKGLVISILTTGILLVLLAFLIYKEKQNGGVHFNDLNN